MYLVSQKTEDRQKHLMAMGVVPCYVDAFENRYVNSDDEIDVDPTFPDIDIRFAKVPFWRSEIATQFIDFIEKHKSNIIPRIAGLKGRPHRGNQPRPRRRREPPVIDHDALAPSGLPEDWYRPEFLARLTFQATLELKMGPRMFPASGNFLSILPTTSNVTLYDPEGKHFMPSHISNIPLAQLQTNQVMLDAALLNPAFQFQNHALFQMPEAPEASTSASKPPPDNPESSEMNSLFDGINSDMEAQNMDGQPQS